MNEPPTHPRRRPASRIAIVLFDGFDELDAIGPFEVLSNATRAGAPIHVELVGSSGPGEIVASHGLRVTVTGGLTPDAEILIVPGGGWNSSLGSPGARAEVERGSLPSMIAALHDAGMTVASVCTGAMILAAGGLLRGRPATTHRSACEDLARSGALLVDARVVDDGDVITSGGVTSGIDLALWLVERDWGPKLSRSIALQIEHEPTRAVWTTKG